MTDSVFESQEQNAEGPVTQERVLQEGMGESVRMSPPPLRQRGVPVSGQVPVWAGKTAFADLFVVEGMVPPVLGSGPQEKIDYFREKLRRSESLLSRLREAWMVREREIDQLEGLFQRSKVQAEESQQRVQELSQRMSAMERFLEQKKQEFEAYGQRVTHLFASKEEALKAAQARVQELERVLVEMEDVSGSTRAALEHDVAVRDEAIAKLKMALDERRASMFERDEQNEQLTAELARISDEAVRMKMAYESHIGQMRETLAFDLEQASADCRVRDEIIQELRATVLAQQEASREREERIQAMSDEWASLTGAVTDMQGSLEQHAAQLMEREDMLAQVRMTVSQLEAQLAMAQDAAASVEERFVAERDAFERDRNDMAEAYQTLKMELLELQSQMSSTHALKREQLQETRDALKAAQTLLGG